MCSESVGFLGLGVGCISNISLNKIWLLGYNRGKNNYSFLMLPVVANSYLISRINFRRILCP